MIESHKPVPIADFNGLFGIDSFEESTPAGFFQDELNTITYGTELRTRDGFDTNITTIAGVVRFVVYRRQGEASRLLYLTTEGNIIDSITGITILSIPEMLDFSCWFSNNRVFISPHNGRAGLPGEKVYVYNGSGVARPAAGLKPGGASTVTQIPPGSIEAGTHIFAWVFETVSGFLTPPGPGVAILFEEESKANFSNVPIGPSGTAARRLIASKAIQDYNGNIEGYEMFFVPGGRINNNVDTQLNNIDFFDAELVDTADYVYDQLEFIPAVVFIVPYGRRMCYGGPDIDKNLVYISKDGEPESISSVAGFIPFDPHETEGVKDATEYRDNLFVIKPNRTYTCRDNTYEPSTWKPIALDKAIGGDVNCIAQYLDAKGARVEFWIVADYSGLYKFDGVFQDIPLSRNIKNWWNRINRAAFNKVQVLIDQESFLIYVLVPLDGVISPNYIIVGNFENGFSWQTIKWHLWKMDPFSPSCIGIDHNFQSKRNILKAGSMSNNIYEQIVDKRSDVGIAIEQVVQFAPVGAATNAIHHVGGVGFRVKGNGTFKCELFGIDNHDYQRLLDVPLRNAPGMERLIPASFMSEKASLRLSLNSFGAWFKLRKVVIYSNVIYNTRPGVEW